MPGESIEKFETDKKEEMDLEEVAKEIDGLIEKDKDLRKEREPADSTLLASVTRGDLAEEDFVIFKKCQDGNWTFPEWRTYTDNVSKHIDDHPKDKTNNSRDIFRDWLAKKAQLQFEQEIAQERQAKE
jgi:hypothetical protein